MGFRQNRLGRNKSLRYALDALMAIVAISGFLIFFLTPDNGASAQHGGMQPSPQPAPHNPNPPPNNNGGGGNSCTCVNGVCSGNACPAPPPPPPAGNFQPQPARPSPRPNPPPPPPAANFVQPGAAPAITPTAEVKANPPAVGAGAATNGPAVDVSGKAISTSTEADDGSSTMQFIAFFLALMGAAGVLILLMMANRV